MTAYKPDDEDIEEDPRVANVYRRMRMLVGLSLLVMGVGFAAVFGVIAYRLMNAAPAPAGVVAARLDLPAGARVMASAADGGRLYVTVQDGERTIVHVLDGATLRPLGRLDIGGPPGGGG